MNVLSNIIRSVCNTYLPYQYKWHFDLYNDAETQNINSEANLFLSDPDNSTASIEVLKNVVSTGLGVFVVSTDYAIDGSIKPILYSIPDVLNVRLDADASKLNFSDATKAAIFEIKSKEWFEQNYGIDASHIDKPLVDISSEYDHENSMVLVTYFIKRDDGVYVYKLAGNSVLEEPTILPYSYLPVIPVFGEQYWDKEGKQSWSGICKILKPIQRLINYSYRQLIMRCAVSPKFEWVVSDEAIDGYESYYKNSNKLWNPLRLYHQWSKDGKREIAKPERDNIEIQFTDAENLLQSTLQMCNGVIGIPATGLETEVEQTATQSLINLKTFNNNIRAYLYNLKFAFQIIGMIFAEHFYNQRLFGKIKLSVIEGPDGALAKQEARVQLQQFAPMLDNPTDKQKLVIAQCRVEADNEYINNFANSLVPQQTKLEQQQQELLGQADTEIKNRDAQIAELTKQIEDLKRSQEIQAYSLQREMLLADQKFNHEKELKILDAQLEQNNPAEKAKTEAEIIKANANIEKEALSLEKEQMKMGGVNNV